MVALRAQNKMSTTLKPTEKLADQISSAARMCISDNAANSRREWVKLSVSTCVLNDFFDNGSVLWIASSLQPQQPTK